MASEAVKMATISSPEEESGSSDGDSLNGAEQDRYLIDRTKEVTSEWSLDEDGRTRLGNYINMLECKNFIKKLNQEESPQDLAMCKCNFTYSEHSEEARTDQLSSDVAWSADLHTKAVPTNAYGEIEFAGNRSSGAKFVRVAHDTPMETVVKVLSYCWELETMPNLFISVTGSAVDINMKARLTDAFRRGLMKAALSTGAWILTGGTNVGVMKCVGEAVRDYGLTTEGKVMTIGIAGWGTLGGKESLIDKGDDSGVTKGMWPAKYVVKEKERMGLYLEPHHTHFILVDDGTQNRYGVEIPFRAKFEEEIGKQLIQTGDTVPVCLLVLGGGPNSLQTVYSAILSGTPTVLIKGSGRTAEILAFAYQNVTVVKGVGKKNMMYLEPEARARVEELIKQNFGGKTDPYLEWVEKCVENLDLLSVFELESQDSAKDVDMAILTALLKAKKNQQVQQLELAVLWNRIDIARSEIFTDEAKWTPDQLRGAMLSAIKLNRVDFVKFFLEMDFNLKKFLKVPELVCLYQSVPENNVLFTLMRERGACVVKLEDLSEMIEGMIRNPYHSKYQQYSQATRLIDARDEAAADELAATIQDGDAANELFVWSTLMNYHELGKLFWEQSKESALPKALFAQNILLSLKSRAQDAVVARELQASIDDYGQLAAHLINDFYKSSEERTHKLLVRSMERWGNTSCLNLALQAQNTTFVAQPACQSYFNSAWYGRIKTGTSLLLIMLCTIFPPFILLCIAFTEDKKKAKSKDSPKLTKPKQSCIPSRQESMPPMQKLVHFYTSPITKFCLNVYSYVAFLGVFSYILLVQLSKEFHWLEAVLIAWVFTVLAEEMRQLIGRYSLSFKFKLWSYISDSWNILDIINIYLFTLGYGLRTNPKLLDATRVVLGINFITFSFRVLHIFSISKNLGPLLSMIYLMMKDLLRFVAILLVFIVSYSVASEAILYPEAELSWKMIYNLPRKAYWHIYGELFLEDIEGASDCTSDPALYNDGGQLRCPSDVGRYFVPVLLGLYILMTNVMLLNILIAIFSNIFQRIQDNVDMFWNMQLFHIVSEYIERPLLPPPLIFFSHVWLLVRAIRNLCCRKFSTSADQGKGPFCKTFDNAEVKELIQWESIITYNYLDSREKEEHETVQSMMQSTIERVEELSMKIDDIQDRMNDSKEESNQINKDKDGMEDKDGLLDALKQLTLKLEKGQKKREENPLETGQKQTEKVEGNGQSQNEEQEETEPSQTENLEKTGQKETDDIDGRGQRQTENLQETGQSKTESLGGTEQEVPVSQLNKTLYDLDKRIQDNTRYLERIMASVQQLTANGFEYPPSRYNDRGDPVGEVGNRPRINLPTEVASPPYAAPKIDDGFVRPDMVEEDRDLDIEAFPVIDFDRENRHAWQMFSSHIDETIAAPEPERIPLEHSGEQVMTASTHHMAPNCEPVVAPTTLWPQVDSGDDKDNDRDEECINDEDVAAAP